MSRREGDMVYRWKLWPVTKAYCVIREVNSRNIWGVWCDTPEEAAEKAFEPKARWTYEPKGHCYRFKRAEDLDLEPPGGKVVKSFMSFIRKMDKEYNLRV